MEALGLVMSLILLTMICEKDPNEIFFSNLVLGGGEGPIIVEPPQTEVIIDETNEPECGK